MKKRKKPVSLSQENRDTIKSVYIKNHPVFGAVGLAKLYNVSRSGIHKIIRERKNES